MSTINGAETYERMYGTRDGDVIHGNGGSDIIYGGGDPGRAFVSMTFMSETAGNRNAFGVYEIGPNGEIGNVQIVWANASAQGSGGSLIPGQTNVTVDVAAGATLGFFLLPNAAAARTASLLSDTEGRFEFRNPNGSQGNVGTTSQLFLIHIDRNGRETRIQTDVGHTAYHSAATPANGHRLNEDGTDHTIVSTDGATGGQIIAFEDQWRGGDRDFNDLIIRVTAENARVQDGSRFYTNTALPYASGDDLIYGGDGHDRIHGMDGDDEIHGEVGNDWLRGDDGDDLVDGGSGEDDVSGGQGNDVVFGGAGNDVVNGNEGDDKVYGGNSNDTVRGSQGNDAVFGDDGDDMVFGDSGNDAVSGGAGNDRAYGGTGTDIVNGDSGNDDLYGGTGDDGLFGGDGQDRLYGNSGHDALSGDKGDDLLYGGSGNDQLDGGTGNDLLYGGSGTDTLSGGDGLDKLWGQAGDDVLSGGASTDILHGGSGNDLIFGGGGFDTLLGTQGNDALHGDEGNDLLDGGTGNDFLFGGTGTDTIIGGHGDDVMAGGAGHDVFVFTKGAVLTGVDQITDFTFGQDRVDFTQLGLVADGFMASAMSLLDDGRVQIALNDYRLVLTGVGNAADALQAVFDRIDFA